MLPGSFAVIYVGRRTAVQVQQAAFALFCVEIHNAKETPGKSL